MAFPQLKRKRNEDYPPPVSESDLFLKKPKKSVCLICPHCHQSYLSVAEYSPVLLDCGHTLCELCFAVVTHEIEHPSCPLCNLPINTSNKLYSQQIEILERCSIHPEYPSEFVCTEDECPQKGTRICLFCVCLNQTHQGHSYIPFKDFVLEQSQEFSGILQQVELKEQKIMEQLDRLSFLESQLSFSGYFGETVRSVNRYFDAINEQVENRRTQTLNRLKQLACQEFEKVETMKKELNESLALTQSFKTRAETADLVDIAKTSDKMKTFLDETLPSKIPNLCSIQFFGNPTLGLPLGNLGERDPDAKGSWCPADNLVEINDSCDIQGILGAIRRSYKRDSECAPEIAKGLEVLDHLASDSRNLDRFLGANIFEFIYSILSLELGVEVSRLGCKILQMLDKDSSAFSGILEALWAETKRFSDDPMIAQAFSTFLATFVRQKTNVLRISSQIDWVTEILDYFEGFRGDLEIMKKVFDFIEGFGFDSPHEQLLTKCGAVQLILGGISLFSSEYLGLISQGFQILSRLLVDERFSYDQMLYFQGAEKVLNIFKVLFEHEEVAISSVQLCSSLVASGEIEEELLELDMVEVMLQAYEYHISDPLTVLSMVDSFFKIFQSSGSSFLTFLERGGAELTVIALTQHFETYDLALSGLRLLSFICLLEEERVVECGGLEVIITSIIEHNAKLPLALYGSLCLLRLCKKIVESEIGLRNLIRETARKMMECFSTDDHIQQSTRHILINT